MPEDDARGSEGGDNNLDVSNDLQPCPVCRNFDPDLAPRVKKRNNTIFSPDPFGFTLGVKVPNPGPLWARIDREIEEDDVEQEPDEDVPLYEIDKPILEVMKQGFRGCKACQVLFKAFFFSWTTSETVGPERRSKKAFKKALKTLHLHAMFSPGRNVIVNITTRSGGIRSVGRLDVLTYQLFTLSNKPNPWDIIGRLGNSPVNVLNEEYRDFVQRWIGRCADSHPYCGSLIPSRMPKRLLDVGSGNMEIRLEQDITNPSPYIALSHCWQFSQPLKMTKDRLKQRGTSIHLEELSPTLRDAVQIARWIGIQYIWIDSLCIIQDDLKDWQEQSVQMGNIYRQSYFTIAAHVDMNSPSPTHGCFLERKTFYEFTHQDDSDRNYHTLVRGDFTHTEDPVTPISLTGRGWCYQERLLASRIIHFRPGEISFECFSNTTCECEALLPHDHLPWPRQPYESVKEGFAEYARVVEPDGDSALSDANNELDAGKAWMAWHDIVSNYATSAFTFKTDRFPALASVASRMPKRVFGSYLAGLWTKELISELLWRRSYNVLRFRDKPYVAPSFSWASGSGSIVLWSPWKELGGPYHLPLARVLEVNRELVTPEPFGQVRDGSIRLSGRVAPVKLRIPFLQRMYWILKPIPAMQRVEWLDQASEIPQWFCYKLRGFAWKLDHYPSLHFARDYVRHFAESLNTHKSTTVAEIAQLTRGDKSLNDLDGWTCSATSDTEEDSARMVLENLIAIELATWTPDFAAIENNDNGRVEVGALLLAPSRRRKGAYDRVAHIHFLRDIKEDDRVRIEDGREENLRRLNDCFAGCEEREIVIV